MAPFDDNEDDDFWPDEPVFDPESPGPYIELPEAPEIGDGGDGSSDGGDSFSDGGDGSSDVVQTFWLVVIMVDIGLLAISLGAMIVVFRGQLRLGGGIFAGGVLALLSAYRHYWKYQNS